MSLFLAAVTLLSFTSCSSDTEKITQTQSENALKSETEPTAKSEAQNTESAQSNYKIINGTEIYRDFTLDNILQTDSNNDVHFNLYIPKNYDGDKPYALYITLPGYEGLYFQGVGVNLKDENFAFEAQKYNNEMIIAAPQLNGWDENSANETIALTEYLISVYNIDKTKVYISGYSGGGETASIAVGKRPDLFTAYLQVSSQWDGEYESVAKAQLPVYIAIGRDDEYYGSTKSQNAYNTLYNLYEIYGLSESEIDGILVLDIKEQEYFTCRDVNNEHAGGGLFAEDYSIMFWLFGEH